MPLRSAAIHPFVLGGCHLECFRRISIEFYETALCTNPSRKGRILLALEQNRIRLAERRDCQIRLVAAGAAVASVNRLGICDDIARPTLRTFVRAFHMMGTSRRRTV
jgi:hypothetical protein